MNKKVELASNMERVFPGVFVGFSGYCVYYTESRKNVSLEMVHIFVTGLLAPSVWEKYNYK